MWEPEKSKRRTKEHPNLIDGRKVSILGGGQMALGVGTESLTRRKRKKTGLVNTDETRLQTDLLHVFLPAQAYLTYVTVSRL